MPATRHWSRSGLALVGVAALGCQPIVVDAGRVTVADIAVRSPAGGAPNIVAIGTSDDDGRIVLRTTGASIERGQIRQVGVMGPGMVEGTAVLIVGVTVQARFVRYAETQGGGVPSMPAVVLEVAVPVDAPPGIYSIVAVRGDDASIFTGGLEVL